MNITNFKPAVKTPSLIRNGVFKPAKPKGPSESTIQIQCVDWFGYQYPALAPLLIAVPNGGSRSRKTVFKRGVATSVSFEAIRMKREGARPGAADLILLKGNGKHGYLCIEMKTKKGVQSQSQKDWQAVIERHGNCYVVCRSLSDFMKVITNYLQR